MWRQALKFGIHAPAGGRRVRGAAVPRTRRVLQLHDHGVVAAARRVIHAHLAHPVRRQMRVEATGGHLGRLLAGGRLGEFLVEHAPVAREGTAPRVVRDDDLVGARLGDGPQLCHIAQVFHGTCRMKDRRTDRPVHRQVRQQLVRRPHDRVDDLELLVQLPVVVRQIGDDLMGDAERARRGVDDERQSAAGGPAPGRLDDPVRHDGVALVVALRVPDRGAACPRDIVRNPDRPPRARGDGDHGLREGHVPRGAEDAVDAGRVVDRGGPHARGARQLPGGGSGDLGQPLRYEVGADGLAGGLGHGGQEPVADLAGGRHGEPRRRLHDLEVLRRERGHLLLARGVPRVPELLHEGARVDADRARQLAGRVARARVHRVVPVRLDETVLDRRTGRLAHHLAAQDDPLAGRGRQVLAGAGRFTEAALDARVGDQLHLGDRLEAAQMGLGIAIEDDTRREDSVRVDDLLGAPHQLRGLRAPFELQERRDVAPRGVLGLEGTVEALDGEAAELVHERRVPLDVLGPARVEGEQEVQIAVRRMTGDGGVEAVPRLEFEERLARLGQA